MLLLPTDNPRWEGRTLSTIGYVCVYFFFRKTCAICIYVCNGLVLSNTLVRSCCVSVYFQNTYANVFARYRWGLSICIACRLSQRALMVIGDFQLDLLSYYLLNGLRTWWGSTYLILHMLCGGHRVSHFRTLAIRYEGRTDYLCCLIGQCMRLSDLETDWCTSALCRLFQVQSCFLWCRTFVIVRCWMYPNTMKSNPQDHPIHQ